MRISDWSSDVCSSDLPLAGSEWLAIADAQGHAAGVRILAAAAIEPEEVAAIFADRIVVHAASRYDAASDRVDHRRERRLGAIALASGQAGRGEGVEDDVAVRHTDRGRKGGRACRAGGRPG